MAEPKKPTRAYRAPYQKAPIARMDEAHISDRHVYRMLSDYCITLGRKAPGQKAVSVAISDQAFADAQELAGQLGMRPEWMLGRLLEAVLAERNVAVNLLDGVKAPKAKAA
ncbi:MAG: hypothetical protein ACR652_19140 [Methylocystis sp.]|uniref:hypothetical protein n=1 Tax=Methylocystis sp. TaxID=1911079 RepID=UPI003DA6561D